MSMTMNNLSAFEQGEYDALMGYECRTDECAAYYDGYATQYAQEQCQTAYTIEQIKLAGGQYDN